MIPTSDVAFSPSVEAIQSARGSRDAYARMEAKGGFRSKIDDHLTGTLAEANSAYIVTASAGAQPYAQHRAGPRGFIRVVDDLVSLLATRDHPVALKAFPIDKRPVFRWER